MIKKLITVVILLTFSLVLFACNGGGDESSAATNITMYVYQPEDWAVEYINKVKKDFNDQYKGEIKALQKVLEYDDFTIDCLTRSIKEQEE